MNSIFNKNVPTSPTRSTWQELQIRQLLESESIPFEFQKVFSLPNCRYIIDFFLSQSVILECASTAMYKYQVPLRKKAIHLEAKSLQLKNYYPNLSIWVLFETHQPILTAFSQTLIRLMPSVDQVFFSRQALKEALQYYFLPVKTNHEVIR